MAVAADVRRIALALAGTSENPHFDRAAFTVVRIYATLAADGLSLNLKLTPDEQHFKTMLAPEIYQQIDNAWGRQGWTCVDLRSIGTAELTEALRMAWEHGRITSRRKR